MNTPDLDRATILAAVFDDLRRLDVDVDEDAVGGGRIVSDRGGPCVGLPVVKEIFGRVGVRTRSLQPEGRTVPASTAVAEVGGPLAAIRGAAPLALTWLQRLGAVASGAVPPEPGNPLDDYASRLSAPGAVGDDEPSFHLELEG